MAERVTCPCCGYLTLMAPGDYEVCPVCGWEDDGASTKRPLIFDGNPNGISLAQAQRRHRRYGATYPNDPRTRPPRAEEVRDPAWKAVEDPAADDYRDVRDLTYLVVEAAERARDEVRRGGDDRARGNLDALRETVVLLCAKPRPSVSAQTTSGCQAASTREWTSRPILRRATTRDEVGSRINGRPRQTLGFKTPSQALAEVLR